MGATRTSPSREPALPEAARSGDQEACRRLVEGDLTSAVGALATPEVVRRPARSCVFSPLLARFAPPPGLPAR